jgi:hypothetical protein
VWKTLYSEKILELTLEKSFADIVVKTFAVEIGNLDKTKHPVSCILFQYSRINTATLVCYFTKK